MLFPGCKMLKICLLPGLHPLLGLADPDHEHIMIRIIDAYEFY